MAEWKRKEDEKDKRKERKQSGVRGKRWKKRGRERERMLYLAFSNLDSTDNLQ